VSGPQAGAYEPGALSAADDLLAHQIARPVRFAGTSDHRFYDRYWFEAVSADGEVMVLAGLAFYRNTGMCDGFVSVQRDQRQLNVRVARPLGYDLSPAVGGLSIAVERPFEVLTLQLAPGDHPLSAHLSWRSVAPPHLENPTQRYDGARIAQDTTRYGQLGELSGWITVEGDRIEVDRWWAVRDHSWGVRAGVGGFEVQPSRTEESYLHLWTFASTDELHVYAQQIETGDGDAWYVDGVVTVLATGQAEQITGIEHHIDFLPGTREWETLRYRLTTCRGRVVDLVAHATQRGWAYRGVGYSGGFDDWRGLGAVRPETLEWDVLDLSEPGRVTRDGEPYAPGHREQPATVEIDGHPGRGHLATVSTGSIRRYGLGPRAR
jgi:hypothetical protein